MALGTRLNMPGASVSPILIVLVAVAVSLPSLTENRDQPLSAKQNHEILGPSRVLPLGLESAEYYVPKNNPATRAKIELGRLLFFDKRLSADDSVACASCHSPDKGFSDNLRVSLGIHGRLGRRNAPTTLNRFSKSRQFWDGRAESLEEQAKGPLVNPLEMGMRDLAAVVRKIASIEGYRILFQEVFAGAVSIDGITKAIAAFERTMISGNSRWDQFNAGDRSALTIPERRGLVVFTGKGRCNQCHSGWNLTDEKFHNIGIGWDNEPVDAGRLAVTGKKMDKGSFKTPTLREISRTAPYMHDGRFGTLEEVVDYYNEGVIANPFLDVEMVRPALLLHEMLDSSDGSSQPEENASVAVKELHLSDLEKSDVVAFLGALEGDGWRHAREPDSFPE